MEEAKEAPVEMEPAEVSDDADFFDESWVAAAPAAAVEVNAEEAAVDADAAAADGAERRDERCGGCARGGGRKRRVRGVYDDG